MPSEPELFESVLVLAEAGVESGSSLDEIMDAIRCEAKCGPMVALRYLKQAALATTNPKLQAQKAFILRFGEQYL